VRRLPSIARGVRPPERSHHSDAQLALGRVRSEAESDRCRLGSSGPVCRNGVHVRHHSTPLRRVRRVAGQAIDLGGKRRASGSPAPGLAQGGPDGLRLVTTFAHQHRQRALRRLVQTSPDDSGGHKRDCSTVCVTHVSRTRFPRGAGQSGSAGGMRVRGAGRDFSYGVVGP
jgi:hypothetical protein